MKRQFVSVPRLPLRQWLMLGALLAFAVGWPFLRTAVSQEVPENDPGAMADAALSAPDSAPASEPASKQVSSEPRPQMNYLALLMSGGPLMIPLAVISMVVLAYGLERGLALRRSKVVPQELVAELGQLSGSQGGLDPQAAYKVCQKYPSPAAQVIRAALLKVGRPHTEVEAAWQQAATREANSLFHNVRTIMLGISVAPLLGLLGTVQGMIEAFFVTSNSPIGTNRAELLADGIYKALVTTLAGLSVAIPAALLAHYYEGRIQRLFADVEELLLNMLPQLERFEGRLRVKRVETKEGGLEMDNSPRSRETAEKA